MILEIEKNILLEALNITIKGISSRNIIPILNCIKFKLEDNGLFLISTDNDLTIEYFIPKSKIKNIESLGDILISGKYFYEIIRKMPQETIRIEELIDNKLLIKTSNSSFTLNSNNVNEYPDITFELTKTPIKFSQNEFKNIITEVSYACSFQESRPMLTGINFNIFDNTIEITATDSYRLVKKNIFIEDNLDNNNITIPHRNIMEIIKSFQDTDNLFELHILNNKITFILPNLKITSSLLNGKYPNTSNLLPDTFKIQLELNKEEFINSIDRASLLTSESDKNTINCEIINNQIIISSNIPEIGNVKEIIKLNQENNNNFKISFSSKYMLDTLKNIYGDKIIISFNEAIEPFILNQKNNNDTIHLIVPIRTY